MSNNAESIRRKLVEKLRRPASHAFIIHCGTKSIQIAHPNTLTDRYIQLLPNTQPYLNFDSDALIQAIYYYITKYTVLIHWWVVYAILLLCWSTPCLITLFRYTLSYYVARGFPIPIHCCAIPNLNTLWRYIPSYYMGKQVPISIHCWAIPNPNTLFRYT